VLAGLGGVVFLSEQPTMRLVLSSLMIIGGVALALIDRKNSLRPRSST
jgi:drug/metabolite transporter (DMT)-like permease